MRKIFLFFAILSGIAMQAQTLKTFNGTKVGELNVIGNVTYTYYEEKSEANLDYAHRPEVNAIKHGAYKYVAKSTPKEGGSYSLTVSGNLKYGYKNGIWTYIQTLVDYPSNGNEFITGTKTIKISYQDGIPNGQWTYSNSQKVRTKSYNLQRGWYWNNDWKTKPTESAQVTYNNGILTGPYSEKILEWTGNIISTTGQLNSNGFLIGNWKSGNNYRTYSTDGYLIPEHDTELQKLQEEYKTLPKEQYNDFFIKHHIKVDTLKYSHPSIFDNKMFETKHYEHHTDLKSDIKEKEIIGGRFIRLEKVRIKTLGEVLNVTRVERFYKDGYIWDNLEEDVKNDLEENKIYLTNEDILKCEKIIKDIQNKKAELGDNKKYSEYYKNTLRPQLETLISIDDIACPTFDMSNKKNIAWISDITIKLLPLPINKKNILNKYLTSEKYEIRDFINDEDYNSKYDRNRYKNISTKERCDNLTEYIEFLKNKQSDKVLVNQLYCLPSEIYKNMYSVEETYVSNINDIGTDGDWTRHNPKKIRNNKLYEPYFKTIQYMVRNINHNGTFEEIYNSLNDINNLCLFMLDKKTIKASNIEKELEKTDKVENCVEIFKKYIRQ